jgi:hypothetical protein
VPKLPHPAPAAMVWAEMAVASRSRNRRAAACGEQGNGDAGELVQCLRRNRTASTMITMTTMTPKLINMGYSSRICRSHNGEPGWRARVVSA